MARAEVVRASIAGAASCLVVAGGLVLAGPTLAVAGADPGPRHGQHSREDRGDRGRDGRDGRAASGPRGSWRAHDAPGRGGPDGAGRGGPDGADRDSPARVGADRPGGRDRGPTVGNGRGTSANDAQPDAAASRPTPVARISAPAAAPEAAPEAAAQPEQQADAAAVPQQSTLAAVSADVAAAAGGGGGALPTGIAVGPVSPRVVFGNGRIPGQDRMPALATPPVAASSAGSVRLVDGGPAAVPGPLPAAPVAPVPPRTGEAPDAAVPLLASPVAGSGAGGGIDPLWGLAGLVLAPLAGVWLGLRQARGHKAAAELTSALADR